jgi:CelD/BcsL family acetyltransferase involved in cellulose biosynthesis
MDFDTAVKMHLYETIAQTTKPPTSQEAAQALDATVEEVEAAFDRLHKKRLLVPEPGDPSRIRMAPPFSGIETAFRVRAQGKFYYANCAWDALGYRPRCMRML